VNAVRSRTRVPLKQTHSFHQLQVWLSINNLVVDPNCRAKYNLDDFRKEKLLQLRRFMNQLLIDQLPVLSDLQRVLDELAFNYQPNLDAYSKGGLVIEQVHPARLLGAALTSHR
jgi:hypothetical protein